MRPKRVFMILILAIAGIAWELAQARVAQTDLLPLPASTITTPGSAIFDPALNLSPAAASILKRSCADCHSAATRWPWYAGIPPASWLLHQDVEHGRKAMDLSLWSSRNGRSPLAAISAFTAACSDVRSGRMPRSTYLFLHPEARLNPRDVQDICAWTSQQIATARTQAASQRAAGARAGLSRGRPK
jgi:hypothetical protein